MITKQDLLVVDLMQHKRSLSSRKRMRLPIHHMSDNALSYGLSSQMQQLSDWGFGETWMDFCCEHKTQFKRRRYATNWGGCRDCSGSAFYSHSRKKLGNSCDLQPYSLAIGRSHLLPELWAFVSPDRSSPKMQGWQVPDTSRLDDMAPSLSHVCGN